MIASSRPDDHQVQAQTPAEEGEPTELGRRYPQRERGPPRRFPLHALHRIRNDDEPSPREALKGLNSSQWQGAMKVKVDTLKEINCWTVIKMPVKEKVLHS